MFLCHHSLTLVLCLECSMTFIFLPLYTRGEFITRSSVYLYKVMLQGGVLSPLSEKEQVY